MTTRDWEAVFSSWAQPPGKTEQERCENAIGAIANAIGRSDKLRQWKIKVFSHGSYRNRVNVRQDSDVDVGVMFYDYFLSQYPEGKSHADFGNYDADYGFAQFKNELEEALVAHFGRAAVTRGNKAFDVNANSHRVEADVVPLFEFRQYWESGSYRAGVALIPDLGGRIENYPERLVDYWPSTPLHYENGVSKNDCTSRRFKGIVRILKNLRNDMAGLGYAAAKPIPGYLLECMAWNAPNPCFGGYTWDSRVKVSPNTQKRPPGNTSNPAISGRVVSIGDGGGGCKPSSRLALVQFGLSLSSSGLWELVGGAAGPVQAVVGNGGRGPGCRFP